MISISLEEAIRNAGRYLKNAVRMRSNRRWCSHAAGFAASGRGRYPGNGHGSLPQSVQDGGYRLHGKNLGGGTIAQRCLAVQEAGALPWCSRGFYRAQWKHAMLTIPTMARCRAALDGQVQVTATA